MDGAMLSLLSIGGILVALLVARLPVATCPECDHCRAETRQKAEEQRRLREEYERREGIPPQGWADRDDERRSR